MSRGKAWSDKMDAILIRWYAEEESTQLARQFGYGLRTIERHAAQLGLKKSEALLRRIAKKGSDAAKVWIRLKKERGEKIEKSPGGRPFEKGHKWDAETERRRIASLKVAKYRLKNLEMFEPMSKFVVKRMSTVDLEKLLKAELERVYVIRQELDRRKCGAVYSEMSKSVNFEKYVSED